MLVVKLDSASDGLSEREATGLGDSSAELVPDWLGHILSDKGVLGLNFWEGIRHLEDLFDTEAITVSDVAVLNTVGCVKNRGPAWVKKGLKELLRETKVASWPGCCMHA